jgi:pimeloyl-ACP methyl ester carboxylesterase
MRIECSAPYSRLYSPKLTCTYVKVGMTFLGFENPPGVTTDQRVEAFKKSPDAAWYNAVHLKAYEKGGHFAPFENPEAIIVDIRETFRRLN